MKPQWNIILPRVSSVSQRRKCTRYLQETVRSQDKKPDDNIQQTPFSSINLGMDTSPEGRLAIRKTLEAIDRGLGNNETSVFPIVIFQVKTGINYMPTDPNYDLFRLSCKVSAKRLFPNWLNLNASFNSPYYKEGDYNSFVATMGFKQPFRVNRDPRVSYR